MADATCTFQSGGAVATVLVGAKIKVRYEFNTITKPDLALPYAAAIDGKVLPEHAHKAPVLDSTRCIELTVAPGSQVILYLNSDALPAYRQNPVYPVTVGGNDIIVRIKEKVGLHPELPPEIGQPVLQCAKDGKVTEIYNAWLTGNTWMLISHRYTWEEAQSMLPSGLPAPIQVFLRRIYSGFGSETMYIDFPAAGTTPALLMTIKVSAQGNVISNVSLCQLGNGVLPRTHPAAYIALFSAAYAVRLDKLRITSGWRPMMGSIAHRAGLGLDVDYIASSIEAVILNRESLTSANATGDGTNVSAVERNLYRDYQQAKADAEASEKEHAKALKLVKANNDPSKAAALKDAANIKSEQAIARKLRSIELEKDWAFERNKAEPQITRDLRRALSNHPMVSQLLDPWYIDTNTKDTIVAAPNEQVSGTEITHNNHLHITVKMHSMP